MKYVSQRRLGSSKARDIPEDVLHTSSSMKFQVGARVEPEFFIKLTTQQVRVCRVSKRIV